jgi:predicted nucleic acid-binding protein
VATYLLDTNTFSAIMDQRPQAMAHAAVLSSTDEVVICAIVRGEILYGIERCWSHLTAIFSASAV